MDQLIINPLNGVTPGVGQPFIGHLQNADPHYSMEYHTLIVDNQQIFIPICSWE